MPSCGMGGGRGTRAPQAPRKQTTGHLGATVSHKVSRGSARQDLLEGQEVVASVALLLDELVDHTGEPGVAACTGPAVAAVLLACWGCAFSWPLSGAM